MTVRGLLVAFLSLAVATTAVAQARLERLGAILTIEQSRRVGSPELARLLRDATPTVRRRAALAAGRIPDHAALPLVIDLMNDPVVEVRQMAAFALGIAGDAGAVERLVAALQDHDSTVRARAAEALGRLGGARAAGAIADYVLWLLPEGAPLLTVRGDDPGNPEDPWLELRLGLLGLARAKDVPAARRALLLEGRPRFDWWAATWVASRLEDPGLRPVLLAAAGSSDAQSRALAARGLGALKDPAAIELLANLARDADEHVASNAVRALGRLGGPGASAAAGSALRSRSEAVRYEALLALADLPRDRSLRERVVEQVGSDADWIRAAALPALARTAPEELPLILSGLESDVDWPERAAKARALGIAGGEIGVGILHGMLSDPDPRVLPSVLSALRRSRGADAHPTLLAHLAHPDVVVRAAAAEELLESGVSDRGDEVAAALSAAAGDAQADARLALVRLLGKQTGEPAREALRSLAGQDPDVPVRRAAAQALAALGETPPEPFAVPLRPHLDERELMLPYDPRPGEPLFSPRAVLKTSRGEVEIALDRVEAPTATARFVARARRGFYDGLTFHRFVPGFVIQGGCPRGDGAGAPGAPEPGEPGSWPYGRGSVGIANAGRDTDGSQFFVALGVQPQLDGVYTQLGRVTRGLEIVETLRPGDRILRVEIWDGM